MLPGFVRVAPSIARGLPWRGLCWFVEGAMALAEEGPLGTGNRFQRLWGWMRVPTRADNFTSIAHRRPGKSLVRTVFKPELLTTSRSGVQVPQRPPVELPGHSAVRGASGVLRWRVTEPPLRIHRARRPRARGSSSSHRRRLGRCRGPRRTGRSRHLRSRCRAGRLRPCRHRGPQRLPVSLLSYGWGLVER
jgi:hypothetical protein